MKNWRSFVLLLWVAAIDGGCTEGSSPLCGYYVEDGVITLANDDSPVRVPEGCGGHWWTIQDACGSFVDPPPTAPRSLLFSQSGMVGRRAKVAYRLSPAPSSDALGVTWTCRDASGAYARPLVGVGFSFKADGSAFAIPQSRLGIQFWAKGSGSALDSGIRVELPTADTDVATAGAAFRTSCSCGARLGKPCVPANGAVATDDPEGVLHTCLGHFYFPLKLTPDWTKHAVLFRDLKWADEGEPRPWIDREKLTRRRELSEDTVGWDGNKALKIQFVVQASPEPSASTSGDLSIDEVRWVGVRDEIKVSGSMAEHDPYGEE